MSALTREARRLADGGSQDLARSYAAIASAEALERIASKLEQSTSGDLDDSIGVWVANR